MEFSSLERVDLRAGWKDEAINFTPWLRDNIGLLGDALGLKLEVEMAEKPVGPFWADLLCKDLDTDQWVVVENQLEKTNHNHLGQLLT